MISCCVKERRMNIKSILENEEVKITVFLSFYLSLFIKGIFKCSVFQTFSKPVEIMGIKIESFLKDYKNMQRISKFSET